MISISADWNGGVGIQAIQRQWRPDRGGASSSVRQPGVNTSAVRWVEPPAVAHRFPTSFIAPSRSRQPSASCHGHDCLAVVRGAPPGPLAATSASAWSAMGIPAVPGIQIRVLRGDVSRGCMQPGVGVQPEARQDAPDHTPGVVLHADPRLWWIAPAIRCCEARWPVADVRLSWGVQPP